MTLELNSINLLTATLCIGGVAFLHHWIKVLRNRPGRVIPGPRGLPLLGNILDMPQQKEWETFAEWAKEFGELDEVPLSYTFQLRREY